MLGDDIEKITKATGIKKVVDKIPGDCGCNKRKEKLNNPDLLINKILYKKKLYGKSKGNYKSSTI